MRRQIGVRKPEQRTENDGSPRLVMSLDSTRHEGAVIMAVPTGKHNYRRGYVWIGTDAACFGHISARRLLALADAIREESRGCAHV